MHQPSVFRYLVMLHRDYINDFLKVILGDLTSTGSGSSKKQAKHAAARAMLDKLDGRVPAQDGQTPLPPVADTANGPQAPGEEHPQGAHNLTDPHIAGNTVGALQELCVKHGYPMPTYDLGTDTHFKMTLKCYRILTFCFEKCFFVRFFLKFL